MTDLRTAAQQALEALEAMNPYPASKGDQRASAIAALRARLAEPVQEPDLFHCPKCGGPADNGHDRSIPPNPYFCTRCMAEPVHKCPNCVSLQDQNTELDRKLAELEAALRPQS